MTSRGLRAVAVHVLYRVTEQGAFATPLLDAELRRAQLIPRDAALASQIVYGALRILPDLDARIAVHLRRPEVRIDPFGHAALRVGAFQLLHLSRVPSHAAVDETVRVVRDERGRAVAGFVNAVLRKVARQRPDQPTLPDRMSVPAWFREVLGADLGEARTRTFLADRPLPPPLGLRVRTDRTRAELAADIRAKKPSARVEEGAISPLALLVWGGGDPRRLPGYPEGAFSVQEQGAQAVALLLGASSRDRVADVCAGHGTKTTLYAETITGGHLAAFDLDERKLNRIQPELRRLQIDEDRVETVAADLTVGVAGWQDRFDRVLVDAPCSGLGTVHRRPELLLRRSPSDVPRLAELQGEILSRALTLVRPGGVVVYAVCSPLQAEGRGVVDQVLHANPNFESPLPSWPLPVPVDSDGAVRLGPWNGHCDAYQVFQLRRRG